MTTVKDLLETRLQLDGDRPFILFRDQRITFEKFYRQSVKYANLFLGYKKYNEPFHIAIMMYNYPEFLYAFGGCALSGATLVGVNTELRGEKLAKVLDDSDSLLVLTDNTKFKPNEQTNLEKLQEIEFGFKKNIFALERVRYIPSIEGALIGISNTPQVITIKDETPLMIIYTSGTTGLPKGIINNHDKFVYSGSLVHQILKLGSSDTCYVCMPLFHSNSMFLAVSWALVTGGKLGLREKFSVSNFWDDGNHYQATWWNYVGTPMNYLLDEDKAPPKDTDYRNTLKLAVGNGSSANIQKAFAMRFGVVVNEVYGQTETGLVTRKKFKDPHGSIGKASLECKILKIKTDKDGNEYTTEEECAPAVFDEKGSIVNFDEAVGELVEFSSLAAKFTGYYKMPGETEKVKGSLGDKYYTGDLTALDKDRNFYFFGRVSSDRIRKKGENFSSQGIEDIVDQHPNVTISAVYGVPHELSDDYVMLALELKNEEIFDTKEFYNFCKENLSDEKWIPDFVRIAKLEKTGTHKIIKNPLRAQHFNSGEITDKIFWRKRKEDSFGEFTTEDYQNLIKQYEANGTLYRLKALEQRYKCKKS